VIGVALEAANNWDPAFPMTDLVTVPRLVDPLMNSAVKEKVPKEFDSVSKPKVVAGTERVIVKLGSELVLTRTLGVAVSAAGGEFQVLQPETPTCAIERAVGSVTVWIPSVTAEVVVPLFPVIAKRLVPLVYVTSGFEIGVNCPSTETGPKSPRTIATLGITEFMTNQFGLGYQIAPTKTNKKCFTKDVSPQ
jgi:hypothetical protein